MSISFSPNLYINQDLSSQIDSQKKKTELLFNSITIIIQMYTTLNKECHETIINAKNNFSNRIINTYFPENDNCNALAAPTGEDDPIQEMIEMIPTVVHLTHNSLNAQHNILGNGMESEKFATLLTKRVVSTFLNN